MKIEVDCRWTDDEMNTFENLVKRDFKVLVDEDYIDNEDELVAKIADEIYREYGIVIETDSQVRKIATNFYDVLEEIEENI